MEIISDAIVNIELWPLMGGVEGGLILQNLTSKGGGGGGIREGWG